LTVGDELRKVRMDKGLTQHEVAQYMNVYPNFPNEMELGNRINTIYALHKVYLFLGYVPKTLNIDETSLRGKLFAHRIRNGSTYNIVAKKIGLDKSTLSQFEKGKIVKTDSQFKVMEYIKSISKIL
jgi:transcriptional regulator with XRE-family HTH domain